MSGRFLDDTQVRPFAQMAEWSNALELGSSSVMVQGFESSSGHHLPINISPDYIDGRVIGTSLTAVGLMF